MTRKYFSILVIIGALLAANLSPHVRASNPPILITEVKTGYIDPLGVEYAKNEFVELTNVSPDVTDIAGWQLQYLSSANDGSGQPTSVLNTFDGSLPLGGHALFSHSGYNPGAVIDGVFGENDNSTSGMLAKSGGHIRLMNGTNMIDCVSWGSAVVISGCDKVSSTAPSGYSIQRPLVNGVYNKTLGVVNLTPESPRGGDLYIPTSYQVGQPAIDSSNPAPPVCDGVILSEILPNPAGDDAQGEFIELYNPTVHLQSLYGCSLKLANGKQYAFPAEGYLLPQEYKAFPYVTTGLQLTNGGGEVDLITSSQTISAIYPSSPDDQAWALIAGNWYATDEPTPNFPNVLHGSTDSASVTVASTGSGEDVPCAAGKYRNPDTGRCKNIATSTTTTIVCQTGYQRNPATNRCRKIVAATTPTACQKGYTRSADTNRCRKIAATTSTQKPCSAGQVRNAATGRCRKVTTAPAKYAGSVAGAVAHNYRIILAVLLLVLAYGVYEYRQDIANLYERLKARWTRDGAAQ